MTEVGMGESVGYAARLLALVRAGGLRTALIRLLRRTAFGVRGGRKGYRAEAVLLPPAALTATVFYRNYPQTQSLFEIVIPDLVQVKRGARIKVLSVGCSVGCEPFSLAIEAAKRGMADALEIWGVDVDKRCVRAARRAVFSAEHFQDSLTGVVRIPEDALREHFEREARRGREHFRLRTDIAKAVRFEALDILRPRSAMPHLGEFDLILLQNTLLHFSEEAADQALEVMLALASRHAYVVLGGADLDWLERRYQDAGLVPVLARAEEIHDAWVSRRRLFEMGDRSYLSLEPFGHKRGAAPGRYCSIFRFQGCQRNGEHRGGGRLGRSE